MKKIRWGMMFLMAVVFFAVLVVHAQSNKEFQPKKVTQKAVSVQSKDKVQPERIQKQTTSAVSEIKAGQKSIPERSALKGFPQGYKMVMDVLGELVGEYEWDNYRIPVRSTEQPSAIWISKNDNYTLEPGFVHASSVMRGDANADGVISIGDVVHLINYLFISGPDPYPTEVGDANCDGTVDIADAVHIVNYLFIGGPPPGC